MKNLNKMGLQNVMNSSSNESFEEDLKEAFEACQNTTNRKIIFSSLQKIHFLLTTEKIRKGLSLKASYKRLVLALKEKQEGREYDKEEKCKKTKKNNSNHVEGEELVEIDDTSNNNSNILFSSFFSSPFEEWLHEQFEKYVHLLLQLLHCNDTKLQLCAVRFCMQIVSHEGLVLQFKYSSSSSSSSTKNINIFPLGIYQIFTSQILQCKHFSPEIVSCLLNEYLNKYADLRYYFFLIVKKIVTDYSVPISRSPHSSSFSSSSPFSSAVCVHVRSFWYTWQLSTHELSSRLFFFLSPLFPPSPASKKTCEHKSKEEEKGEEEEEEEEEIEKTQEEEEEIMCALKEEEEWNESDEDEQVGKKEKNIMTKCFIEGLEKNKNNNNCCTMSKYRIIFQTTWLTYMNKTIEEEEEKKEENNEKKNNKKSKRIKSIHKKAMLKNLLRYIPNKILPYMSMPLSAAEFFIYAFGKSEDISVNVLALYGLFFLLVHCRLGDINIIDYSNNNNSNNNNNNNSIVNDDEISSSSSSPFSPSSSSSSASSRACGYFYSRLYYMISPSIFTVPCRSKFLKLLYLSLRSSLLPSSCVSLFIKKCARTACLLPPHSSLWLISLVYTLLVKHNSVCLSLVHTPPHIAKKLQTPGDTFDYLKYSIREEEVENKIKMLIEEEEKEEEKKEEEKKEEEEKEEEKKKEEKKKEEKKRNSHNDDCSNNDKNIHVDSFKEKKTKEEQTFFVEEENKEKNKNKKKRKHIDLSLCVPKCEKVINQKKLTGQMLSQMGISLWEIDLYEKHYLHTINQITNFFKTDFTQHTAHVLSPDDFMHMSFSSFLRDELKVRKKKKSGGGLYAKIHTEKKEEKEKEEKEELKIPAVSFSSPYISDDAFSLMKLSMEI